MNHLSTAMLLMATTMACSSKESAPQGMKPTEAVVPAAAAPAAPLPPVAAEPAEDADEAMQRAAEDRLEADLIADARRVLEALSNREAARLSKLAPASARIVIESGNAQSDDGAVAAKTVTGAAALVRFASDLNVTEMTITTCDGACCTLEPSHDDERALGAQVREICFEERDAGRALAKLRITFDG